MKRSIWRSLLVGGGIAGGSCFAGGCGTGVISSPDVSHTVSGPSYDGSSRTPEIAAVADQAEVSWDTEGDAKFARFLRDHSGGMIKKAAVGIEKRGELKIEINRSVEPEDTLALTKSVLAGG